ncbi:hypothetical protein GCM10011394_16750 [Luteimonas terricola]|uniref:SWIM-type domain-containing protein n=1 Tax=Luteimonas terricola TaxID=645597 RepID=A0ABQ2EDK8_9GAMM|nr:hypothetical protein GCM10011394_16750 [Luteimonas terricola]
MPGTKALECSCPPALACGQRLLLDFALKGLGTRRATVRGGPRSKAGIPRTCSNAEPRRGREAFAGK